MKEGTLIPAVPKEYSTYSNQEKIEKTEKYYRKIGELYNRIEVSENGYIKRMDALLGQNAGLQRVFEVLKEKEAQCLCFYVYEFYILKILCQIAEKEEKLSEPSLLQNIHSMEDVIFWQQKCVFLLRRFEMDWEEDDELLVLVQQKRISYIFL